MRLASAVATVVMGSAAAAAAEEAPHASMIAVERPCAPGHETASRVRSGVPEPRGRRHAPGAARSHRLGPRRRARRWDEARFCGVPHVAVRRPAAMLMGEDDYGGSSARDGGLEAALTLGLVRRATVQAGPTTARLARTSRRSGSARRFLTPRRPVIEKANAPSGRMRTPGPRRRASRHAVPGRVRLAAQLPKRSTVRSASSSPSSSSGSPEPPRPGVEEGAAGPAGPRRHVVPEAVSQRARRGPDVSPGRHLVRLQEPVLAPVARQRQHERRLRRHRLGDSAWSRRGGSALRDRGSVFTTTRARPRRGGRPTRPRRSAPPPRVPPLGARQAGEREAFPSREDRAHDHRDLRPRSPGPPAAWDPPESDQVRPRPGPAADVGVPRRRVVSGHVAAHDVRKVGEARGRRGPGDKRFERDLDSGPSGDAQPL